MNTRRFAALPVLLLLAAAAPEVRPSPLPAPLDPGTLPELLAQAGERKITRSHLLERVLESKFHRPILDRFVDTLVLQREAKRLGIRPTDAEIDARITDFQQKLLQGELVETVGLALLGDDFENAEKIAAIRTLIESLVAGRPDWDALQKKMQNFPKERMEEARESAARVMRTWAAGDGLPRALARAELTPAGLRGLILQLLEVEAVARKTLGLDPKAVPTKDQQEEALRKLRTDYRVQFPEVGQAWEKDVACIIGSEKIPVDAYLPFFLRKMGRGWVLSALEDLIQEGIVLDRLENLGKSLTDKEIEDEYRERQDRVQRQPRSQDIMTLRGKTSIEIRREIRMDLALCRLITPPTDEQLAQYYDANRIVFGNAEIRASHIMIAALNELGQPRRGTSEASFEWAKKRAEEIREQVVEQKATWEDLVKKHSDHRPSKEAAEPGDLGWFPRRGRPDFEPIAKVAFEGEEPGFKRPLGIGAVSQPILSERGYHLILVTNIKRPTPPPFKEIQKIVLDDWFSQTKTETLQKLLEEYTKTGLLRRYWPPTAAPAKEGPAAPAGAAPSQPPPAGL